MPSGKREAAAFKQISALAAAQPEEIRTRRTAAEETYNKVLGRLGATGTYENVGGTPPASPSLLGSQPQAAEDTSIFKTEKVKSAAATDIDRRFATDANLQDVKKLDADATVKSLEGTSQFRTMSRLQAEAEQLVARQGPLWDELIKNQQLPIIEGSAAMARENAESVRRAFAKGGAARRTAFETVERIRSQERINSQKIQQIANARVSLDKWSRENAQNVIEFGQKWASNLGGIREEYNRAMDSASELMVTGAIPQMMEATQKAADLRKQAHEQQRNKTMRWVKGVVGVVLMVASRGAAGGSLVESAFQKPGEGGAAGGGGGGILGAVGGVMGMLGNSANKTPAPAQITMRGGPTPVANNPSNSGWQIRTGNAGSPIKR